MAHLNIYKKRQVRRTVAYQVLMDDLIELGIVDKDEYLALTNIKRGELEDATPVAAIDDFGNPMNEDPENEDPENEDPENEQGITMSFYTKLEELIPNDEELRNKIWDAYDEVRSEDRREQENDKLRERVRDLEKQLSTVEIGRAHV